MSKYFAKQLMNVALIGLLLGLAACQSGPTRHEKNAEGAQQRWKDARGGLLLQAAQRQFDAGDLTQAQKTINDAINYDPSNAKLHLLAGRINFERGKLERCFRQLELAAQLDEKLSLIPYYQAIVVQRWQRYEEARLLYIKASQLEPDNVAYLMAIAEMDIALQQPKQALERLLGRVDYFDQNAGIRVAIADVYCLNQDYENALEYYRQAVILDSDNYSVQEELASTLVHAGRSNDAIEVYEQLLEHEAYVDRQDLHRTLAQCYEKNHELEKARRLYNKMRQQNPRDVQAWVGLGNTALNLNDLNTAMMAASRLRSLAPDRHEGFLIAGLTWHQRGLTDRSAEMFARVAELLPDSAQPLILQGLSLQQSGKLEAAAQAFAQAIQREPTDPRARQLLAKLTDMNH